MRFRCVAAVAFWSAAVCWSWADPLTDHYPEAAESGCMRCHSGIEPIREPGSEMLDEIMELGQERGDPAGCIVCHGGDPSVTDDEEAAHGVEFYPAPGSPWINEHTCGQCHQDHVRVQWHSLMMTEAGEIQQTCWAFGSLEGYRHRWGNYAVKNPDDPGQRLGTDQYRAFMEALKEREPNVFVDEHEPLPEALQADELGRLMEDPSLAAFTYIRQESQPYHLGVRGRQVRGDYRGIGCAACHIPFSNAGYYEGDDPSIDHDTPGHVLVHSIQGTREAKVTVHGTTYSGIPVATCATCHNRGKRIGVSFPGLMESPYASPYNADGGEQPALHTKHYLAMEQDVHYQQGMLCQDCHTTLDVHSDGFLAAANLAAVQIECADCHGTPDRFPWELPLGFMDEFGTSAVTGPPRGVTEAQLPHAEQGFAFDPEDGFLLTARGNPFENVVRQGDEVIVHTAGGKDLRLKPLKKLVAEQQISLRGMVAMRGVARHLKRMECYACHAKWTPQSYGSNLKLDYSQQDKCPSCQQSQEGFDWVAAGRKHQEPPHQADRGESGYDTIIPGKATEQRTYTRWEDPILGVNGEGRVSPLAPGCQAAVTVLGEDGKPVVRNHIFRTLPDSEGAGEAGQLAIDMSPIQPHTTTTDARTCESCHASNKALGLGIESTGPWNEQHEVDLETVEGEILAVRTQPQIEPIEGLDHDWSQIVDADGRQVTTVGTHFELSRAFNKSEMAGINEQGACLACHQELPTESLAVSFLYHVAQYTGQLPETTTEHNRLLHKLLLTSAWAQVLAVVVLLLAVVAIWRWRRKVAKRA